MIGAAFDDNTTSEIDLEHVRVRREERIIIIIRTNYFSNVVRRLISFHAYPWIPSSHTGTPRSTARGEKLTES